MDKNLTQIQMKKMIKKFHMDNFIGKSDNEELKKNMNMRDLLKITRSLNENTNHKGENKKTVYDQKNEEEKFKKIFDDMNVTIKFIDLEIYDNLVFWGGTVDGVIQFVYKVTPYDSTSGVEFNYLKDYSPDNPENDEIISRIESYFDTFYKYWRNNIL